MRVREREPVRVVLADGHPLIRAGLAALLDRVADVEVVGEAGDAEQAVAVTADRHPDVVLMDVAAPGADGIAATRRVLAAHRDAQVLVLTAVADRARVEDALGAGATGYLLKDAPPA